MRNEVRPRDHHLLRMELVVLVGHLLQDSPLVKKTKKQMLTYNHLLNQTRLQIMVIVLSTLTAKAETITKM